MPKLEKDKGEYPGWFKKRSIRAGSIVPASVAAKDSGASASAADESIPAMR